MDNKESNSYWSNQGFETRYEWIKSQPERLARHRERALATQRANRKWLAEYKSGYGCFDCGYNEHFSALQLDHTGPKTAAISELRTSIKRMKEEIEKGKCIVRCANCHAVKTWCDKNGVEYNGKNREIYRED